MSGTVHLRIFGLIHRHFTQPVAEPRCEGSMPILRQLLIQQRI